MDSMCSSSNWSTISENSSIDELLRLRAGAKGRKSRRLKELVEVTSLDQWIQKQTEIHAKDPTIPKTKEEIEADKNKKQKFNRMTPKDKKAYLKSQELEMKKYMANLYLKFQLENIVKKYNETKALENRELEEFQEVPTRINQLDESKRKINYMLNKRLKFRQQQYKNFEWEFSFTGGKLPYPLSVQNVNAYITNWMDENYKTWTMKEVAKRIKDVMFFIYIIQDYIDQMPNLKREQLREWRSVLANLKIMLQKCLDYATNHIIIDVLENMETEDYITAHISHSNDYFMFALRARLPTPIPRPNPLRPPPPPAIIEFDSPKLKFFIPASMNITNVAIRILILNYDHISSQCASYMDADCPVEYDGTFKEFIVDEWKQKQKIKYERRRPKGYKNPTLKQLMAVEEKKHRQRLLKLEKKGKKKVRDKEKKLEQKSDGQSEIITIEEEQEDVEPELTMDEIIENQWLYDREIVPVPSDLMNDNTKHVCKSVLDKMFIPDKKNIINLQKYLIVGGVKYINFLKMPIQPNRLMIESTVYVHKIPVKLTEIEYNFIIPDEKILRTESKVRQSSVKSSVDLLDEPSRMVLQMSEAFLSKDVVDKMRTRFSSAYSKLSIEEDSEETIKEIIQREKQNYLNKMVSITMEIPRDVYWIDDPVVCRWDDRRKYWTTRGIYESTIDHNQWTISFRTGRFGCFGFAISRHFYLPFLMWNLKPVGKKIVFTLKTKIFDFAIEVDHDKYVVTQIKDNQGNCLTETKNWNILNREFHLNQLKEIFHYHGIDIFPCFDSFNCIKNASEKFWVFERYLYYCVSLVAFAYEFKPSKWNFTAGLRKIFFQTREVSLKKFRIVCVDVWRTYLLRIVEDDLSLDLTPEEGIPFSADFYQYYKNSANISTKKSNRGIPSETRVAILELLCALRPFSFTYYTYDELPPSDTRCWLCQNNEKFIS